MYTINLFNRSLIITLVISSLSPMRMGGDTVMVGSREEGLDIVDISRLHSGKFLLKSSRQHVNVCLGGLERRGRRQTDG